MQGTLDTFGAVEVLQMLGRSRRSGTLHIECPQRLIDVRFIQGRIAETRDSTRVSTDTVLGSQLLRRSLVKEQQLAAALGEQEVRPRPVGTILVEHGSVTEDAVREVLSRQIANTLVAAKLQDSGTFVFITDPDPQEVDFITVDPQSVLLDISTLGGEYCLAVEMLGQPSTMLVRNGDYDSLPRKALLMGRDEFIVLLQVDGTRTVKELMQSIHLEEVTVVSILGKLVDAGVLLIKTELQASVPGDEGLQAHRDSVWAEVSQLLDDVVDDSADVGDAPVVPSGSDDQPLL